MCRHRRLMASATSRRRFYFLLALMLGASVGLMLGSAPEVSPEVVVCAGKSSAFSAFSAGDFSPTLQRGPVGPNDKVRDLLRGGGRHLIVVGVMTAQKYLDTRALAVHNTWARTLPGHVIFFTGAHALAHPSLPVVRLPGVDDAYPPQKKSFLMLKFMSENLVGRYEWFMRADDDVYVRGDQLGPFLRSINSSRPQFIGQAGMGNKEEFGQLNLEPEDNFCMGGPGIVFSAETLRKVGPNVKHCLKNLYSTHEDVEVGRCVRHFAGIPCTWSYEMQTIFYHNSSGREAFTGNLKQREIHRAITLHPVKQHHHFYRLHNYFASLKMKDILQTNVELDRDIRLSLDSLKYTKEEVGGEAPMGLAAETHLLSERHNLPVLSSSWESGKPPGLMKTKPRNDSEVLKWEFVHRAIYSFTHSNPRRGVNGVLSETLNDVVSQIMERINRFAKQRGRVIDFKDILYAYTRFDPRHGADYILDLLLVYKKYRGRKMTLPVRKHVYVQQTFTALQIRSLQNEEKRGFQGNDEEKRGFHSYDEEKRGFQGYDDEKRGFENEEKRGVYDNTEKKRGIYDNAERKRGIYDNAERKRGVYENSKGIGQKSSERINFILPLAGRLKTFRRFVDDFERVCLTLSHPFSFSLVVVLYPDDENGNETARSVERILESLKGKYGEWNEFSLIQRFETFSRARALDLGSSGFADDQLLLFIDVDMRFDEQFVRRVLTHTTLNQQVYFPIVFSQYDPSVVGAPLQEDPQGFPLIDERWGYWRVFGFGIVSLYRGDLRRVGGLDLGIRGWGQEDVDLYDKVIRSPLLVFRAPDPGLVHVFHSIDCDHLLPPLQLTMCRGSKASSLAGVRALADIVYNNPDIIRSTSHLAGVLKDEEDSARQR